MNIIATVTSVGVTHLLISFLIIIIVLAIIYGVMWAIENWVAPIPQPVKVVLAIILLLLIVIWAVSTITGTAPFPP